MVKMIMSKKQRTFPLKGLALITLISWTVCILISVVWNKTQRENEVHGILRQTARTSIERDKLYRLWNARHDGVYVPMTKTTQPNPYLTLQMAPHRDLKISANLTLTMINPAYMSRQIYELAKEKNIVTGHLVSLNPVNPKNMADPWEQKALQAVEQGAEDYSETISLEGQEYFRMLLPLRTERPCLKCHAVQGYKEGDLRGGITVSLPETDFHNHASSGEKAILLGHSVIWAIGLMGILLGYVALARGQTARAQAEEQILNLAHFDTLTGLVNRNLFQDRVTQALTLAKRQKNKIALLYIDLDRFKPINDTFGHETGDSVLQEVAKRLLASVRESDTVARIGGDEFVVVVPDIQDKQQVAPLAQKILAAMQFPFLIKAREHSIGASIGISCFPDDGEDMDALMQKADAAMYLVKSQTRGSFQFFG